MLTVDRPVNTSNWPLESNDRLAGSARSSNTICTSNETKDTVYKQAQIRDTRRITEAAADNQNEYLLYCCIAEQGA